MNKQIRVIISGDNLFQYIGLEDELVYYIQGKVTLIEIPTIHSYEDRLKYIKEILKYEKNKIRVILHNDILEYKEQ